MKQPGYCALCRSRCGAQFVVERGRLVGVEPWPGHPTGGALCAKGRAAPELQYHPARLTQPLRRTTPRSDADPRWVACSWDEAMADIAARLSAVRQESGGHTVAFSCASPGATALSDSLEWIERLIFAFGSPNFLTGVEICNWHRDHGHAFTFGTGIGMPDYENTDLVMLWGFSPGNVWLAQAQAMAQAKARGVKLLVVDPARTRHAASADLWLQVRPGTDSALALGIARDLIASEGFDQPFVRNWSNGPFLVRDDNGAVLTQRQLAADALTDLPLAWDEAGGRVVAVDTTQALPAGTTLALRGHRVVRGVQGAQSAVSCRTAFDHYAEASEPYTPEHVQALTGVPAAQVVAAARMITCARRVSYFSWTGIAQHAQATQTDRAIALLYALTGCVDAPGGNLHLNALPVRRANDRALLGAGQAAKALGLAARPLGPPALGWTLAPDFHRAATRGEPYRVRALVGFGANLLMSQPDSPRMREALQALEFQVHVDMFETPTGRHADYLLPASTPWEREGLRIGFEISGAAQELVQLRPPAVAPSPGNAARPDIDIVFDMALRLGFGDVFFDGDVERGWNHVLGPLGLTLARLRAAPEGIRVPVPQAPRKYIGRGFATPSRRIEFYSSQLKATGASPVPRLAVQPGAPAADFPLTLCGAKSGYYCQSQHRQLPTLRAREPEPQARLRPALAEARGIANGDWCEVHTHNGSARLRALYDDALAPDVVMASFGWWQACEDLGLPATDPLAAGHSNINAIIDASQADATAGSTPLRSFACDVRVVPGPGGWNGWKAFTAHCASRPAEGVIEIVLKPQDGRPLPDYLPGQYVRIEVEVPGAGWRQRNYSLIGAASAPSRSGHAHYTVAVRRSAQGASVSEALHRSFDKSGAMPNIRLQRPAGRFLLPVRPVRPVVVMAAGIGITPFLSMLETMALEAPSVQPGAQPVLLMYGNRDMASHAFADRIQDLAKHLPMLQLINFHSRALGANPLLQSGRMSAPQVPDAWIAADARFYLCGPPAMLRELRQGLLARGVPQFAIFSESFNILGREMVAAAPDEKPHTVRFARSGCTAVFTPADSNLLALAERLGVGLAGGCRVGQCESCRVTLKSGHVAYLADVAEQDEGECLACVAVPASDLEIDA